MAVGLTAEQQEYVARIRAVATDHLAGVPPVHGAVNRPLVAALGEHGLLRGLFGGAPDEPYLGDAAALQLCLLRETLATVNTEAETALALQGLGSYPILQSGSRSAVDRWIPGVVAGSVVAAFALSEPDAGSDAAALSLPPTATATGPGACTARRPGSPTPPRPTSTPSSPAPPRLRARAASPRSWCPATPTGSAANGSTCWPRTRSARLVFDGVRVTADDVLGEVDHGFAVAMRTLDLFRPSVGAFAVGMAQAALDAALDWALTREVYGDLLIRQQSVEHTLAEMATRTEAARLLVRAAATTYDSARAGRRGHPERRDGQALRDRDRAVGGRPGGAAARRAGAAARPPARAALS